MSLAEFDRGPGGNPVDLVERLAAVNDWSFERSNESEITLSIKGRHTNYNVSFQWMDELEALHTACAFDLKVPEPKRAEIYKLLAMVNEQLWLGHFDLWSEEGLVMYRDGLVLSGGAEASGRQCEALLENAVSAAERYYPAFQFVIWAGKNAREAMDATLFETAGEA
ncbi:MAG: YbjN domain-containing protein [Xanthobacteraceae bacterium]|nr:YbjN domain-containing protein [Xanthobacteraceae bacterium]MBX3534230.1 YbjN domain-containing protein [Xanthobacteraceae bacterium]MCW5675239.1 YbjN domain-containing protein [Xanthobacteraceae bacterium]MCW5676721.1 YbjN domain-containing protein [Xanthobacteraceae bacterium]